VPDLLLGDGGQVDIVLDLQRYCDRGGQLLEQVWRVPAGEVGRVAEPAGGGVEPTGRADRDAVQPVAAQPGVAERAVDRLHDPLDRALGAPAGSGQLEAADHLAGQVGDGRTDPGRRDVQAGDVRDAAVDLVQLGVGARPAGAGPAGPDEPGAFEPGEQLGGGRLGQAGEVAERGAGQRTVREQQVEGGAVVHRAEQAGCTGCAGHVLTLPSLRCHAA
jgi:hypothetical protein